MDSLICCVSSVPAPSANFTWGGLVEICQCAITIFITYTIISTFSPTCRIVRYMSRSVILISGKTKNSTAEQLCSKTPVLGQTLSEYLRRRRRGAREGTPEKAPEKAPEKRQRRRQFVREGFAPPKGTVPQGRQFQSRIIIKGLNKENKVLKRQLGAQVWHF